jgi:multiple sugar transport system substrate-binding protein
MGLFLGLDNIMNDVLLYPVTEEQAERFDEIAQSANLEIGRDGVVMDIINEELTAFLAGNKSAEETARVVQSRIQIYVNEQK